LYLTGKIKRKLTASQDAFDYFGITVAGRHTALGDAFATAQLFSKLINILYRESKGRSFQSKDMSDLFASQNDNI
jgi:DNA polymerase III epsilon subunit-like protein